MLATVLASLFLGAVFTMFTGGIAIVAVLLAIVVISYIISALLIKLMNAVANGPACKRNEGRFK